MRLASRQTLRLVSERFRVSTGSVPGLSWEDVSCAAAVRSGPGGDAARPDMTGVSATITAQARYARNVLARRGRRLPVIPVWRAFCRNQTAPCLSSGSIAERGSRRHAADTHSASTGDRTLPLEGVNEYS